MRKKSKQNTKENYQNTREKRKIRRRTTKKPIKIARKQLTKWQ